MRANVNLDADAYAFASSYAHAKGLALGAAISELIKQAEQAPAGSSDLLTRSKRGFLVKARTGQAITGEMVKLLSEDDLV
jgi:hypothetical protein